MNLLSVIIWLDRIIQTGFSLSICMSR